jgi:hypothetical protein
MLRGSQLANVQVFDEDGVKDEQTVRKRGVSELRRYGSADSSGDSVEAVDFLKNYIGTLLSCPHANPKFNSETQIVGMQLSAVALRRPMATAHRVICAWVHPFLMLQPRKRRKLKNPSMQCPGGISISGEVIVGQENPVFQGGNAKCPSIWA